MSTYPSCRKTVQKIWVVADTSQGIGRNGVWKGPSRHAAPRVGGMGSRLLMQKIEGARVGARWGLSVIRCTLRKEVLLLG